MYGSFLYLHILEVKIANSWHYYYHHHHQSEWEIFFPATHKLHNHIISSLNLRQRILFLGMTFIGLINISLPTLSNADDIYFS